MHRNPNIFNNSGRPTLPTPRTNHEKSVEIYACSLTLGLPRFPLHRRNHERSMEIHTFSMTLGFHPSHSMFRRHPPPNFDQIGLRDDPANFDLVRTLCRSRKKSVNIFPGRSAFDRIDLMSSISHNHPCAPTSRAFRLPTPIPHTAMYFFGGEGSVGSPESLKM